jgi:hypothetical protein
MRRACVLASTLPWLLACAACGSGADTGAVAGLKTLHVAGTLADCVGVGPQKCLRVRESPDDAWTLLYDPIEGFSYEEGYAYELRIREEHVPDPPADASAIRRILVEVVSRTPVGAAGEDQDP